MYVVARWREREVQERGAGGRRVLGDEGKRIGGGGKGRGGGFGREEGEIEERGMVSRSARFSPARRRARYGPAQGGS